MTIVYFDSSAFVKLLVEEDGAQVAAALWDGCDAPAIELTETVTTHAGPWPAGMRGADAVHLASLLAVGADSTVLAAWDQRLRAGAQAAGVLVAPEL